MITSRMTALRSAFGRATEILRRVIGVPDHARYLEHMRACHPSVRPLDAASFTRDSLARRYERPGSRCC
jgi:uncharacterized short protein YbdD (DUF466 family)